MDAARAIREADFKCEKGIITVGEYERIIDPFRDVEPVVRCKDCKYWDVEEHNCNIKLGWFLCDADWFCADGIRKE